MIPPIAAEKVFDLFGLPVTNSLINGWIAVIFFIIIAVSVRFSISFVPRTFQNAVEALTESMLKFFDGVTGAREKSERFLPIVGTLFLFILFSNWIGLLPGTGTVGVWGVHNGEIELIPLLRPANADLNMTLAMAVLAVTFSHFAGIFAIGFFKHIGKFIQIRGLFVSIPKGPIAIFTALIEFCIGLLEIISEAAKVVSLSLRLFGNIFAGEVLITIIGGLIAYLVPLPFMALELLVGMIQAMVFSMLVLVYLTVATSQPHAEHA